jgi:hypothetical protein
MTSGSDVVTAIAESQRKPAAQTTPEHSTIAATQIKLLILFIGVSPV